MGYCENDDGGMRSLRVAVIIFVVTIAVVMAVAFVFLFVFFLVRLFSNEDIDGCRAIRRHWAEAFRMHSAHAQCYPFFSG